MQLWGIAKSTLVTTPCFDILPVRRYDRWRLVAWKARTSSDTEGDRLRTATKTNTLQRLSAITGTLENEEVRKWRKQGGKVMGCLCSTIPEEMSI